MINHQNNIDKAAGFWIRLLAQGIDSVIFLVLSASLCFVLNLNVTNAAFYIVMFLVHFAYFTLLSIKYGRTFGKMILKIKIKDFFGKPLGIGQVVNRYFSYFLSAAILGIGFFLLACNKDKRALHDYIAKTKVVYVGSPSVLVILFSVFGIFLFYQITVSAELRIYDEKKWEGLGRKNQVNLYYLRNRINEYYRTKGKWPKNLLGSEFVNYPAIPSTNFFIFGHAPSTIVENYLFLGPDRKINPVLLKDTGHWLYDSAVGMLIIDCTHKDPDGKPVFTW